MVDVRSSEVRPLQGLFIAAAFLLVTMVPCSVPAEPEPSRADETDVLVVGAGIAGLSAALKAAKGGAHVSIIDMSSVFGGHAVMSEGDVTVGIAF
jgi:NADPH-dependent 2,4-dienoyl-CoA reductase/sulfur reductase-like enzyme